MSPEEAVRQLDELNYDPESGHQAADDILLRTVPAEVAEAWDRAAARCGGWWYA